MSVRVVFGEDSYLAREGVCLVLEDAEDIEIVAACGDLATLRRAIGEIEPEVVLADIRMPPTKTDEGIRLAADLRRTHPGVGVVILSHYAEPLYAMELLQEGSDRRAYLLKDRVRYPSDLVRAVREVAAGGSVIDSRIVDLLLSSQRRRESSPLQDLTPREQETLALMAEGWNNGAIAERLVITTRAVERHIHSIYAKLDLGDFENVSQRVKAALFFLGNQVG